MTTYAEAMGHDQHRRIKALEETAMGHAERLLALESQIKDLEYRHQKEIDELKARVESLEERLSEVEHTQHQQERLGHDHT